MARALRGYAGASLLPRPPALGDVLNGAEGDAGIVIKSSSRLSECLIYFGGGGGTTPRIIPRSLDSSSDIETVTYRRTVGNVGVAVVT